MQLSRPAVYAAVGGSAIALGVFAFANRQRLQAWIHTLWNGDADLDHAEAVFTTVADNLRLLRQQLALSADAVLAARHGRLGDVASGSSETTAAAGSVAGSDGVPAALTGKNANGYYYFASTGEKVKNKWDSFDVDAELEKVDKPSAGAVRAAAAPVQRQLSVADGRAALKRVQAVILDGERCLLDIDSALTVVPGSDAEERRSSSGWVAARARKRTLVAQAHALLKEADNARSTLEAALTRS